MARKIYLSQASATDLRRFLRERYEIESDKSASRAALQQKLEELGYADKHIEFETDGTEQTGAGAMNIVDPDTDGDFLAPEEHFQLLVDSGLSESKARRMAGLTLQAQFQAQSVGDGSNPIYGPEYANKYVTIKLASTPEQHGDQPVPVGVNGNVVYVPRDIPVPIRCPFVEVLVNAVQLIYEEYQRAPGAPKDLIARKSQVFPFQLLTPQPYDKAEAVRVAQEAEAMMRGRPAVPMAAA